MTLLHSPSVQSPKAYDLQNLQASQLGARLAAGVNATMRQNLRTALQDTGYRYLISPGETAAGFNAATDLNYGYDPCDSRRYKFDLTGATDNTTIFQLMLDAAGLASNGETVLVNVYPGTYLVKRVYCHYSNVHVNLMQGAILKMTLTGITNSNTTGVAPAYALVHINPLTYLANPASGAAGKLSNVVWYGGGKLQGPNAASPGTYQAFQMGIVSNDCDKCWVLDLVFDGFGAENALLNPSAWNTCTDLRLQGCEVIHGGEFAVNNGRDFVVAFNYVHDSWFQNGCSGNGDCGFVAFNRVRGMQGAGIECGGSGAKDINECRNVVVGFNTIFNCSLVSTAYALFLSDDGATTTPKNNILVIGNRVQLNQSGGGALCAIDYASGTVDVVDNYFSDGVGATSTGIAVIAGSAIINLRGNSFRLGAGNFLTCHDVLGGTPTVRLWSWFNKDVTNDYLHPALFALIDQERVFLPVLTLTGCTTAPNTIPKIIKRGNQVVIDWQAITATSNTAAKSLGTLPTEVIPTTTKEFAVPIQDNSVVGMGIIQIVGGTGVVNLFKDTGNGAPTNANIFGIPRQSTSSYTLK